MDELERTIEWHDGTVLMIDQRVLPLHYEVKTYTTYQGMAEAIHTMVIRGAPAIGAAAALAWRWPVCRAARDGPIDARSGGGRRCVTKVTANGGESFWAIGRMLPAREETWGHVDDVREALIKKRNRSPTKTWRSTSAWPSTARR